MTEKYFLAVDIGASSGRAALGRVTEDRLELRELHRFPNLPVEVGGVLYWDVLGIFREVCEGIRLGWQESGGALAGVGIDTWGVDFGLLDDRGRLVGNPAHYRDRRNQGAMEAVCARLGAERLFNATGLQLMPFNTLFQLYAMKEQGWTELERASTLLMMPDLLAYFLCGRKASEFTIASTTQFLDPRAKNWAWGLLEELGLPGRILPEIVPPGTVLGPLTRRIPGVPEGALPVIAPAAHDTGSAVAAVPAGRERGWAVISSGTWSIMGTEAKDPVITPTARRHNFTNEGGVNGTRFMKNIMGMWLLQECRRMWALRDGRETGYDELQAEAGKAVPLARFIDPDHPSFMLPDDMTTAIKTFCEHTGQTAPRTRGEFARCVLESLALKYAVTVRQLEECSGERIEVVHVVGGGSQDRLLNQLAADAMGVPVIAGPVEATAIGNLLAQAMAAGAVESLAAGRALVAASFQTERHEPRPGAGWEEARRRFDEIIERGKTLS